MNTLEALKLFIKNDNSIVISYNLKNSIITDILYYEEEKFIEKKNYSQDDFCSFVEEFFDVKMDFNVVIENIKENIFDDKQFDIPFIFKDQTGPVKFRFKGGLIDDENLFIVIFKGKNKGPVSNDELTKCISLERLKNNANALIDENESFILGIVDIDNFNNFNQKNGNVLGDIVLIELASTIKAILKTDGMVSRVGGDSFAFYYKTDAKNYDEVRNYLLMMKEALKDNINKVINLEDRISITIGCSRAFVDSDDFVILYNKALKALERGKKKSRDCFIIYFEEKCGPVDKVDRINKIHYEESTTANYSGIAAVIEVLNSNLNFGRRIIESLNLIGTFFMLDRITLIEYDKTGAAIKDLKQWNNPRTPKLGEYNPTNEEIIEARKILGISNLFISNDIKNVKNEKIKECLKKSHTYALLATELRMDDRHFGLIKFEMTSHTRIWQKENIMALNLLAKIISIKYNKEYDTYIHYKQMYFDQETNLFNFHRWYEDVSNTLVKASENKKIKKFIILDLGIMKFSTLFSIVGIKVLKEILKAISESLMGLETEGIIYCRSYENRFTLFIPNDNLDKAKSIFNNVLNAIESVNGQEGEKAVMRAGYIISDVDTKLSLEDLVERAIAARKKANSTVNFLEFNEQMLVDDKFKTMLISHIDTALEKNEFLLYLQPKISTITGEIAGAEALSRWNYNFEKIIFPNDFIPVLENNGYIAKLDYKVFENVCILIKRLEKENKKLIPISVNVSRAIKNFELYFNTLEQIRKNYNVNPCYIEIEITEGMYSKDNVAIENFIDKLHSVGYKVSMDDFGSGNSNISTLSQLTFDTIKFDKAFFNDIDNLKEKMIIDTMTKLVKGMNMKVVCEGVETLEYVKYLKEIGADYIQGYYYDKPLAMLDFEKKYLN